MKKNKNFWDTVIAVGLLLFGLMLFSSLSSCRSSSIPQRECCSHTGVEDTSVIHTEVNFDLVKKDGVIIILPTITKDSIK